MTVKTRILEAASELLARSADADISTRAVSEAAGVTAPTLYHHFGDKDGLLAAVVDFGWAAFLDRKRTVAAVVHEHAVNDTPLTAPELALMNQWLTTLADTPTAAPATPPPRPQHLRKQGSK